MAGAGSSKSTQFSGIFGESIAKFGQPFLDLGFLSLCKTYIVQLLNYFLQVGTEVGTVFAVQPLQVGEPGLKMFEFPRIDFQFLDVGPGG